MPSPEPRPTEEMYGVVVHQAAERRRRRARNRRSIVVVAVLAVIALAATVALAARDDGTDRVSTVPGPVGPPPTYDRDPLTAPEAWEPTSASPLAPRSDPVTAWTGTELLVWGGDGAFSDGGGGEPGFRDGAAYDPATGAWRSMADSPLPDPPNALGAADYASAWTGSELLVWGGPGPEAAAYDPAADTWRSLDPGPLSARTEFAWAWTGSELVVIGGWTPILEQDEPFEADDHAPDEAAAYDPATDSWRTLPGPGFDRTGQAVWTGSEVLWLADARDGKGGPALGMALDPVTGEWRRTAEPPLSSFTAPPVWTGTEVVTVGAAVRTDPARPNQGADHAGAATYDPAADRWTEVDPPAELRVRLLLPSAVWSGREVLIAGSPGWGQGGSVEGVAFDPAAGTWRALPGSGLSGRGSMATAWTGTELILWGGAAFTGYTSEPKADGARYRPGPGR